MRAIAKKSGFKHCYLDASEEVFALYKKIGFEVGSSCTSDLNPPALGQ